MIKFFRKIRQKLLSENKFSKYLIYAIGEIILVVIGILIALQINNLNESKKEQNILNASLNSLKLNLQKDIENLNDQIEYNKTVLKAVDFSFRVISLPEYNNLPLSTFSDSVFHVATERTFFPNTTTFNSMETGSHFQWIKNQDLIQAIYGYYAIVTSISNLTNENNQFVKNHIEEFTYNNIEFGSLLPNSNPYPKKRSPELNNTSILRESAVFENNLIGRKFRSNAEIDRSEDALTKAKELIYLIDEYQNANN
ncbi:DUF6090 family protein [Cyclobacterium sp. SYSU L10401]|uniref:DUF6090 family protein n=1 Tax=Cyclobacterium sp. SYSU L10401 TaxID=2678657 RepID=UPI0013D1339F|nr:DUF6090 family protein [Cyclobacterium sp. SYSU L10401]